MYAACTKAHKSSLQVILIKYKTHLLFITVGINVAASTVVTLPDRNDVDDSRSCAVVVGDVRAVQWWTDIDHRLFKVSGVSDGYRNAGSVTRGVAALAALLCELAAVLPQLQNLSVFCLRRPGAT